MFTWQDVKNVQDAYKQEHKSFLGTRENDGKEYWVGLNKLAPQNIAALTPDTLGRIAVY